MKVADLSAWNPDGFYIEWADYRERQPLGSLDMRYFTVAGWYTLITMMTASTCC